MAELILYHHWRSSSSHRVRIALALKGVAYTAVPVDLTRDEHALPEHTARSPTGFVPCLSVNGAFYVESVAIVELLEELYPQAPALYPVHAHHRARVRSLVEIVNSGIQPLHNRSVLTHQSADRSAQRAWAAYFIERGLRAFERAMEVHTREGIDGPYAYGERPTAADVFLVPQVHAARRFGADLTPFARVCAASAAAELLDAVQSAAPARQADAPAAHRLA